MPLQSNDYQNPELNERFRRHALESILADEDATADLLFVGPRLLESVFPPEDEQTLRAYAATEIGAARVDELFNVIVEINDFLSGHPVQQVSRVETMWQMASRTTQSKNAPPLEFFLGMPITERNLRTKVRDLSARLQQIDQILQKQQKRLAAPPALVSTPVAPGAKQPRTIAELLEGRIGTFATPEISDASERTRETFAKIVAEKHRQGRL